MLPLPQHLTTALLKAFYLVPHIHLSTTTKKFTKHTSRKNKNRNTVQRAFEPESEMAAMIGWGILKLRCK